MKLSEQLLKVEQVAIMIDVSVKTINNWYMWKKIEPNNKLAQKLPDFIQSNPRQTRYWKQSDIWKLIEFKKSIPHGRNGVLGKITQKYINNRKEN